MPQAKMLAVSRVKPNPEQPRKHFDPEAMEELAASIRERGILQPLVVRPGGDGYLIVMGERRYREAILAGLDEVPAIVRDATDEQAYLDALIENLQRANLTELVRRVRSRDSIGYPAFRVLRVQLPVSPSESRFYRSRQGAHRERGMYRRAISH
jgi:ParB/RepB/Spo0J family partition protein